MEFGALSALCGRDVNRIASAQTKLTGFAQGLLQQVLRNGHPAPYPPMLAERLIKLFSFAGDTVLDPFAGTGSTAIAAVAAGRHSISLDIEPSYIVVARENVKKTIGEKRSFGAVEAELKAEPEKQSGASVAIQATRRVS